MATKRPIGTLGSTAMPCRQIEVPVLFVHGDDGVPIKHAEGTRRAWRRVSRTSGSSTAARATPASTKPENRLDYRKMEAFPGKYNPP